MKIEEITEQIQKNIPKDRGNAPYLLAIEGPCATGKTTLSTALQSKLDCDLVSLDHFFLPRNQQGNPEEIGSNIHKEGVLNQVLRPFSQGNEGKYCPYLCQTGEFGETIHLTKKILVVEGVYAMLPEFQKFYHLKIFLTASLECRKKRLIARGSSLEAFETQWIPRENLYFAQENIQTLCDFTFSTE